MWSLEKKNIVYDKPIALGVAILDRSKEIIYRFHYDVIKKHFPDDKARLCLTDTDSLLYDIKVDDMYQWMANNPEHFDFSNYPSNHPLYNTINKRVPLYFKDEMASSPIKSVICLRAKNYSILTADNTNKKTLKGTNRSIVKNEISHAMYEQVLNDRIVTTHLNVNFRSINQQYFTIGVNKLGLNSYDDKRYILSDHTTLAHGHKSIASVEPKELQAVATLTSKDTGDTEENEAAQSGF